MNKLIALAAAAACLVATPALAEVYGSVGYSAMNIDQDGIKLDLGAVTGRVGARLSPHFGIEADASFGTKGDTTDYFGTPVDFDLQYHTGAYLVGFLPVNDDFDVLARVGVSSAKAEASAGGGSADASGSGFEAGVGAQYFFGGGHHGIRADYTYSDNISANIFAIGYAFRFGGE